MMKDTTNYSEIIKIIVAIIIVIYILSIGQLMFAGILFALFTAYFIRRYFSIDILKYIIKNISHRFTRSSLTILSILIGIMAVYALISFGQGVSKYVEEIGEDSGTDKLFAQPKGAGAPGSTGTFLSGEDLNIMRKVIGVKAVTGMIMSQAEVNYQDEGRGKWVFVMGLSTDTEEQRLVESAFAGFGIEQGRDLKKGDYDKITVGYNYQLEDKIFSKPLKLGDKIYINGEKFEIVGIYESIGNAQDDSNIYMTIERAAKLLDIGEEEFGMAYLQAEKGVDPVELADKITDKLRKKKDQKEGQETFYIQSYEELLETFGIVLNVINGILVIIAGISVVVAAVNIMNTMYTAVMERTKEIGIMKAIGSRNSYILKIFFFESGILGLIGGTLGVILGYAIAKLGEAIAAGAGYSFLKPYFPWWLTFGCLFFAFMVGASSGYLPARQASRLKPVDALRYE